MKINHATAGLVTLGLALVAAEAGAQRLEVSPIPGRTGWVRVANNVVTIENWRLSNPSSSRRTTGTLYLGVRATTSSQSTSAGYHLFDVNQHPDQRGLADLRRLDGISDGRLAPGGTIDIYRMSHPLRRPPSGTYYIHIAVYQWNSSLEDNGARTQIGSHTLGEQFTFADGDDHGDGRSSATRVGLPSETAGRIESGSDVDYFRFEVSGTREVTIGTSGSLDTVGTLYDGRGDQLASNDDSGSGYNFSIRRSLSTGTYYVRVRSFASLTGAYTLRLSAQGGGGGGDDHGNGRSAATRVALPSETGGRIESGSDVDYFRFEVSGTREVTIGTSGNLDTVGTLYDSRGGQLASNDDSGSGYNFSIRRSLSAGIYYVRVGSFGSATGAYTLRLSAQGGGGGG